MEWRATAVPGYEVSDEGQVRSLDRTVIGPKGPKRIKGVVLKPTLRKGRWSVSLWKEGKKSDRDVHVLVAEAFIGPRPPGYDVRHWDDDPNNNHASNLLYGTRGDNQRDAVRNGRHHFANKTRCPSGHEYNEKNTRSYQGRRYCRACDNARRRKR